MSYVVLARKWRPKFFEEVVGQGHVAQTLKNSIDQDRVAHSYLFTGARGVGKTSTARILAKALNCAKGPTQTPCYECSSCLEISQGQSVDVFEIDGASNRGINEIRELREGARYAPSRSRYKIYIIDEVHMLTTEAFNALLKTLEEPPPHVKFIFATTEPQKIPVTILSRCQRFDFKRISQHDIVEHLQQVCPDEGIDAEQGALQLIARQAAGGMRDALSLLDQVISFAGNAITEEQVTQILGVANRRHLFELSEAILAHDAQRALLTLDDVHRYGYDLHQFASEMVNHMRDLMVVKVVAHPERVTTMTKSEIAQVTDALAATTTDLLHRYFSVMIDGAQEMSRSPYPKLIFEMTLVRMCQLEPLVGLDLLVDKLHALEASIDDVPDLEGDKKKNELKPVLAYAPAAPPPAAPMTPAAPSPAAAPPAVPVTAAVTAAVVATPPVTSPEPVPVAEPIVVAAKVDPIPEPVDADTPGASSQDPHTTPLDEAIAAAPAPHSAPTRGAQPPPPAPRPPAPDVSAEEEERPPLPEPREDDLHTPDFEQLDEDFDRLAMEAQDEEDMLGLESEEHEKSETHTGRYEVFSLQDSGIALPSSLSILKPDAEEDHDEDVEGLPLPTLDLEVDGRQETWAKVVSHIRIFHAPLAATLEHAYVEEFSSDKISMTYIQRYSHFVNDDKRLGILKNLLKELFGQGFEVVIGTRFEDVPLPGFETLAQLRDAALRARRDQLADDTEHHPIVQQAHSLFAPTASRIMVALHED